MVRHLKGPITVFVCPLCEYADTTPGACTGFEAHHLQVPRVRVVVVEKVA